MWLTISSNVFPIILLIIVAVTFIYRLYVCNILAEKWVSENLGERIALMHYNIKTKKSDITQCKLSVTHESLISVTYTIDDVNYYQLYFGGISFVPTNLFIRYFVVQIVLKKYRIYNDDENVIVIATEIINQRLLPDHDFKMYINQIDFERFISIGRL